MIVGFTGTRNGMTGAQINSVVQILAKMSVEEAHHGICVGADMDFHNIVLNMGAEVIGHPASGVGGQRAEGEGFSEIMEEKPPLDRNRDIVDESDFMIATPKGFSEERRSGTWATIRYAIRSGKPLMIVWPNGRVEKR